MSNIESGPFLDTAGSEAQAIIDVSRIAADPARFGDDLAVFNLGDKVQIVNLGEHLDQYRANPRRKRGSFTVHDAASFCGYLRKHGVEETEVWADTIGYRIVGVINAHEGVEGPVGAAGPAAGWADHRVTYGVKYTEAWSVWASSDGKLLPQTEFADLIEDRAIDIQVPSAADMLEIAENFHATPNVRFESTQSIASGERQFEYRETVEAKAGRAGRLSVPKEFILGLKPFEGAQAYKVTARLRYRIRDGVLFLGYKLERPSDVLRDAFEDVIAAVQADVTAPVFRGVTA